MDTGVGVTETSLAHRRRLGLGLSNVEQRLQRYSNESTPLQVRSMPGNGTTVEIRVPLQVRDAADYVDSVKSS